MNERLRTTSIVALILANAACAGPPTVPVQPLGTWARHVED